PPPPPSTPRRPGRPSLPVHSSSRSITFSHSGSAWPVYGLGTSRKNRRLVFYFVGNTSFVVLVPKVFPCLARRIPSGMWSLNFLPSQCAISQNTLYSNFLNIKTGTVAYWSYWHHPRMTLLRANILAFTDLSV